MSIFKSALAGGAAAELDALAARQKTEDEDALLTKRAGVETQRAIALETYKQAAKAAAEKARLDGIYGGSSTAAAPPGAPPATSAATPGVVVAPTDSAPAAAQAPAPTFAANPNATPPAGNDLPGLSRFYGISLAALQADAANNGGKNIPDLIKDAMHPKQMVVGNNVVDEKGNIVTSVPTINQAPGGGVTITSRNKDGSYNTIMPDGSLRVVSDIAGAQAGVASENELVKRYNPETQREEYVTKAQLLKEAGGSAAPASSPFAPPTATRGSGTAPAQGAPSKFASTPREMDRVYTLNQEADKAEAELARATKAGDTDAAARAQRNMAELAQEMKSNKVPRTPGVPVADAGAPAEPVPQRRSTDGLAAGPSATAKLSNEAQGEANTNWLKNSFQPTIAAGTSADAMLASVAQSKAAMKQLGGTGWGTEAKAEAANVLTGLGLAGDRVKLYAQSAQQFQNAAMSRLQTTLNAAAGTQTNDDAKRAAETYATLKNTTGANDFILDLAQATAERDKLKANFYQNARPVAQKSGDLTEVDRIWQQKAPSVFDLPIMQRWGIKK